MVHFLILLFLTTRHRDCRQTYAHQMMCQKRHQNMVILQYVPMFLRRDEQ